MTITGDWAEGDALTPTNLSGKGGGNFPDRMYNAGWARFGTSAIAKETRIQAAITQAAADGISAVFVPASMLPYDAGAVTFNTSIMMFCEGGATDAYDVQAYGVSFPATNAYSGCQAAIDAASLSTAGIRTVKFPNKTNGTNSNFKIGLSRPLVVKGNGVRLVGPRTGFTGAGTQLYGTYFAGPTVLLAKSGATVPGMVTSLATGGGNAWQMTNNGGFPGNGWFNLRDCPTLELDGLSQLCVEFFYKSTAGDFGQITTAGGRFLNGDTTTNCWNIFVFSIDNKFQATLNTTDGTHTVSGGPVVAAGVTHHVELDYDGSNVYLFVDGALAQSVAATGTIVQGIAEDVIVGGINNAASPEVSVGGPAPATIDGFRVSDIARHTAPFTAPTAKPTNDSHTLAVMNFDLQVSSMTRVQTKSGDFWAWCRKSSASEDGVSGVEIEGLTMGGASSAVSGIFVSPGCVGLRLSRLLFSNYRHGVLIPKGDSYSWQADDLWFDGVGGIYTRYGFMAYGNAQLGRLANVTSTGGVVPILLQGTTIFDTGYILAGTSTIFELLSMTISNPSVPPEVRGVLFGCETGVGAGFRAAIAASTAGNCHASGVILQGCALETQTTPFILADSTDIIVADACNFNVLGTLPSGVLQHIGALVAPAEFRKCHQNSVFIPWAVSNGDATVTRLGTLSASTGSTIQFNASIFDSWDLTLTSDVTLSNWTKISYGQPVSGAIKMDSTGSRLFTWPTNSKGTATLSYGSAAVNTFTGFYDGVNVILTSVRTGL